MNIFILSLDHTECAQLHADQHVGKMLLEACQLLCNCHDTPPYKRTHYNHPCSVWTRQSYENYMWLCRHAHALLLEWEHRFEKPHACASVVGWATFNSCDAIVPNEPLTPFAQAIPELYRNSDVVKAYCTYYKETKQILRGKPATWTKRSKPEWF